MVERILSLEDIKRTLILLREVFGYFVNLRKDFTLASMIKYPQIPSFFTESLALHLLRKAIILPELKEIPFYLDGRIADIIGKNGERRIKIEVKATAASAFQYFSKKDVTADFLVWIHFGRFFLNEEQTQIEIFTIRNPSLFFNTSSKITLQELKNKVKEELDVISFDFNTL